MPRLMSVAYTEQQVRDRAKTVTRRVGWLHVKVGDELDLCRKVMGRRKGDPLVRVARVRVLEVTREPLSRLVTDPEYGAAEMILEGFPGMDPEAFVWTYFLKAQGCQLGAEVTRIRFEYL